MRLDSRAVTGCVCVRACGLGGGARLELFQLCEGRSWALVLATVLLDWEQLTSTLAKCTPGEGAVLLQAIQVDTRT